MHHKKRRSVANNKINNSLSINIKKSANSVKKQQSNACKNVKPINNVNCSKCFKKIFNFSKSGICTTCLRKETNLMNRTKATTDSQPLIKISRTDLKTHRENSQIKLNSNHKLNSKKSDSNASASRKIISSRTTTCVSSIHTNVKQHSKTKTTVEKQKIPQSAPTISKTITMHLRGNKRSYFHLANGIDIESDTHSKKSKLSEQTDKITKRPSRNKKPTAKGTEWLNMVLSKSNKEENSKHGTSLSNNKQPATKTRYESKRQISNTRNASSNQRDNSNSNNVSQTSKNSQKRTNKSKDDKTTANSKKQRIAIKKSITSNRKVKKDTLSNIKVSQRESKLSSSTENNSPILLDLDMPKNIQVAKDILNSLLNSIQSDIENNGSDLLGENEEFSLLDKISVYDSDSNTEKNVNKFNKIVENNFNIETKPTDSSIEICSTSTPAFLDTSRCVSLTVKKTIANDISYKEKGDIDNINEVHDCSKKLLTDTKASDTTDSTKDISLEEVDSNKVLPVHTHERVDEVSDFTKKVDCVGIMSRLNNLTAKIIHQCTENNAAAIKNVNCNETTPNDNQNFKICENQNSTDNSDAMNDTESNICLSTETDGTEHSSTISNENKSSEIFVSNNTNSGFSNTLTDDYGDCASASKIIEQYDSNNSTEEYSSRFTNEGDNISETANKSTELHDKKSSIKNSLHKCPDDDTVCATPNKTGSDSETVKKIKEICVRHVDITSLSNKGKVDSILFSPDSKPIEMCDENNTINSSLEIDHIVLASGGKTEKICDTNIIIDCKNNINNDSTMLLSNGETTEDKNNVIKGSSVRENNHDNVLETSIKTTEICSPNITLSDSTIRPSDNNILLTTDKKTTEFCDQSSDVKCFPDKDIECSAVLETCKKTSEACDGNNDTNKSPNRIIVESALLQTDVSETINQDNGIKEFTDRDIDNDILPTVNKTSKGLSNENSSIQKRSSFELENSTENNITTKYNIHSEKDNPNIEENTLEEKHSAKTSSFVLVDTLQTCIQVFEKGSVNINKDTENIQEGELEKSYFQNDTESIKNSSNEMFPTQLVEQNLKKDTDLVQREKSEINIPSLHNEQIDIVTECESVNHFEVNECPLEYDKCRPKEHYGIENSDQPMCEEINPNSDNGIVYSETSLQFSCREEEAINVDDDDIESMQCNSETRSSNQMSVDEDNVEMELDLEYTLTDVNTCEMKLDSEISMEVN